MYLSESEIEQLDLLKKKTPEQRFELMISLIDAQIDAMKSGIAYFKNGMDEKELKQCLKNRMMKIYSLKP